MLRPITLSALLSFGALLHTCTAQEFTQHANGLIYNDTTMSQLRFIVDSMNIRYRKCDPWKQYNAISQGRGHYISLDSVNVQLAKKDIKNNISYDAFVQKYPAAQVKENLCITRSKYRNYEDEPVVDFSVVRLDDMPEYSIDLNDTTWYTSELAGKWIMEYREKTEYSKESIGAFYITSGFTTPRLPEKYERMIQYVDCMIDTSSRIYTDKAKRDYRVSWMDTDGSAKEAIHTKIFLNYIHLNAVKLGSYDTATEHKLSASPLFKSMLRDAVTEALADGHTTPEMEYYIERYDTKEHALLLKRGRIVVGGCSMDSRPRDHALEIARLSAEAVDWDIFLRAHLDIMNDRFERMSDGSYAYGRRNTYIRELEVLNFDVSTLMLGISLRISNPSGTHYFGNIHRLGRALSESAYAATIEKTIAETISDNTLDDFNRVVFYYLYCSYIYHLQDDGRIKQNVAALHKAVATMPPYISQWLKPGEKNFGKK